MKNFSLASPRVHNITTLSKLEKFGKLRDFAFDFKRRLLKWTLRIYLSYLKLSGIRKDDGKTKTLQAEKYVGSGGKKANLLYIG